MSDLKPWVLKNSEHTWGGDVKATLNDGANWANGPFAAQLAKKAENYEKLEETELGGAPTGH